LKLTIFPPHPVMRVGSTTTRDCNVDFTQKFVVFAAFAISAFFALIFIAVAVLVGRPWFRAFLHGTPVALVQIVAMRLRGNPPSILIDAYIALKRASISTTIDEVENAYIDAKNRIVTSDDLVGLVKERKKGQGASA